MLKLTAVTAFVLLSFANYAQHTISGVVQDFKTHQPLPGATVQVEGINRAAIAGDDGEFRLGAFTTGEYTLVIRHLGYTSRSEKVTLTEATFLTIALEESAIVTDEVVISATRAGANTPITQTTINRQVIQKQNFGQDLPFLLNWTPSLVTTSDAGAGVGYTGLRIRGSDATRINVTINGIPYNDSESLGTFWVDVPDIASSSQSIQIQRGVGTSTNGAGAFGASINLQTNTRNDDPYAEVVNSAGSFGTHRHTASFGTGLLNNHFVLDGRVSKIYSDGFIDRASSELSSYYFSGGFYAGKTMIKAIVFGGKERTYQSWYGVPESRLNGDVEGMEETASIEGWNADQLNNLLQSNSRTFNVYTYKDQVDDYRQDHYQMHFSHRVSDVFSANAALHYTRGNGYYEEYKIDDDFENYGLDEVDIGGAVITSSDIIRRRWLDNDFYGMTYSLNYEKDNLNVILGGAWNRYIGDHFGEITWAEVSPVPSGYRYYFNTGDKHDFNSFIKVNYQLLEKLNTFVDIQYRGVTYHVSGNENKQNTLDIDAAYNFFNPKAGFTYSLAVNHQLYGSFSVGHREPVRDDFADNPGNTPKAETLHNIEAGYRKSGRFTFNLNSYLMNYRNQLVLTGAVNDVGASIRVNADKSYRMGIEAEGIYKISDALAWNVNLTLSKNKIKEFTEVLYDYGPNFDEYNEVINKYSDTDISFSPNVIAGSGLSFFPFRGGEFTVLSKYVGKQFLDNTSNDQRSIDAYFVNDIRVQYTWQPSFMKSIVFSFLLNNILDEEYESNGYTYGYLGGNQSYRQNYYYPQAGRNFMGMVSLKF